MPLKLLLVLIAIFWLLFACFSSATEIVNMNDFWEYSYTTSTSYDINFNWNYNWNWIACMSCTDEFTNWQLYTSDILIRFSRVNNICFYIWYWTHLYLDWQSTRTCTINVSNPNMTSLQCQSEYNLIPINEVDAAYCESNNLCISSSDPIDCPNVWVSNVFINDLFHPWAFNIVMNIPQEIDRDYAYTNSWNNMNIDIVGYNVDYEKMQEVIDTQNYKPNSDDLSTIVSQIVPLFVPWLCIILLLYFIFRFIKKIF